MTFFVELAHLHFSQQYDIGIIITLQIYFSFKL